MSFLKNLLSGDFGGHFSIFELYHILESQKEIDVHPMILSRSTAIFMLKDHYRWNRFCSISSKIINFSKFVLNIVLSKHQLLILSIYDFRKKSYLKLGYLVVNKLSNVEVMIWWHLIGLFYAINNRPNVLLVPNSICFKVVQHPTSSILNFSKRSRRGSDSQIGFFKGTFLIRYPPVVCKSLMRS